ncbi:BON domain-containing protein [Planctomicrobium sp.]|nr:BON domain-containing protein [Planctomicrobium sp.]MDB4743849.1 BON domain-containing protein [Planctomicrobium sp.]
MLSTEKVIVKVDEQGQVTLAGVVATERESKLLESYIRMEPGVRKVNNTLTVTN